MAVIQTGNSLGEAILKALSVDPKMVLSVAISLEPNELATVAIVRCLDKIEADKLVAELEQYELVRKEERRASNGDRVQALQEAVEQHMKDPSNLLARVLAEPRHADRKGEDPMEAARALVKKHGSGT